MIYLLAAILTLFICDCPIEEKKNRSTLKLKHKSFGSRNFVTSIFQQFVETLFSFKLRILREICRNSTNVVEIVRNQCENCRNLDFGNMLKTPKRVWHFHK